MTPRPTEGTPTTIPAPSVNGRYRRLYPRLWVNREFRALHNLDRLIVVYILTGPQTNRIGLFRFSVAQAAEDFGLSKRAFQQRFARVLIAFGWEFDPDARVLWIPSWWRFNAPEGPNQLKGNLTDLNELPQSPLRARFSEHTETLPTKTLRATLTETLTQTFGEPLPKPSPIQEQEQKQEQEQEQDQEQEQQQDQEESRAECSTEPSDRGRALADEHRRRHAACDTTLSHCVPNAVHDKLANLLAPKYGGDRLTAGTVLKQWYPTIWATLPGDFVMPDAFKFWQGRFDVQFASKDTVAGKPEPSSPVPDVDATNRYLHNQRQP